MPLDPSIVDTLTAPKALLAESSKVLITHPNDLIEGDLLILGKRRWAYRCRSATIPEFAHFQDEYAFSAVSPEPGALGHTRVFSQSELQALIRAGFMSREVRVPIAFLGDDLA